ncbi:MAG: UDP-N-acetyl-D-galactosamine dehydrogenase [Alphaproteobacteria bacterium]|nr:UDP-N-acetyl-D-galactosamine dehydrogenase [Alphaproteobacteria bacterium]|tara:strand:- start:30707 stop:31972 length:1266 start_codon:yes stop_codon:yes gene_type:complete
MTSDSAISVIGLGYVGLPLAIGLSRHFSVVALDIDETRVSELDDGYDRTGEITPEVLRAAKLRLTSKPSDIAACSIHIVTVPTPVGPDHVPDLTAVRAACDLVGSQLKAGDIFVLESTVYPGATEEICGPALEEAAGLKCGADFFLGYSPERINPGDREHTVDRITKVVSGQTEEVTDRLMGVYGRVTNGNLHRARDIRTAEAAKVIENAQRDINIAFINEITEIFHKLDISTHDVLEAAGTKWNFLPFKPGLVGGHCIGVDPYYLAYRAQEIGYDPQVILAGRRINDGMGVFIADCIADLLSEPCRVLVLGLTFKENVPDLRNTKVIDLVRQLETRGHTVDVHDIMAAPEEAVARYGVELLPDLSGDGYGALVGAVAHDAYTQLDHVAISRLVARGGLVADIKGMWRHVEMPEALRYWLL